VSYSNSEPNVYVENGWSYVEVIPEESPTTAPEPGTGSGWGEARTDRVSGTADGTRFIVQEQGGVHRVILLSGPEDKVHVVLDGDSAHQKDLAAAQTYFEVHPADTTLPPARTITDPDSEVAQLVDYVESVVWVAGMN
jgi:hypothetical protein